ncbi:MAG: hypothetical protein O2986_09965, partial [Actinomycetota bacterium]|nr:hypothetical protein [Actinomycetota bacterium]
FFSAAHGRLEELLHQTSDLLTRLTNSASMVLGPAAAAAVVRSVQIVGLSTTTATAILVLSNGTVTSEVLDLLEATDDDEIRRAAAHLDSMLSGRSIADSESVPTVGDARVDEIAAAALAALRRASSDDQVFVGGASTVAASFDAVEVVRDVLHTLEQQFVVVSLVQNILDRGMSVAIGVEHGVEPLAACSVVVAPVVVDGEHLGSVGVLGPTRMNYPQALATVGLVSDRLGRHLGDAG